jgi:hypothetical protein
VTTSRNTLRHGSRNTPDGDPVAEREEGSGAGLGGTSPTPLPNGLSPARAARFNLIDGVSKMSVAPLTPRLDPLHYPRDPTGGGCRHRKVAPGKEKISALLDMRGLAGRRATKPGRGSYIPTVSELSLLRPIGTLVESHSKRSAWRGRELERDLVKLKHNRR